MLGSLPMNPFNVLQSVDLLVCSDNPVLELYSKCMVYKNREEFSYVKKKTPLLHSCIEIKKHIFIGTKLRLFQILRNIKTSF